ncbi:thioredoxin domain-containing protein [Candidatus Clostridium radicumherbarum]|uniref:Thioredoxin domain-containing protein n=1 Tax=Candidatus Clostridium radicumherbarum TaxID=3381662 RepID=A0ABW8TXR5_9CLOT
MVTENKHKTTNKLINEKSPYLLQHAHNPVDWYPWGAEAFSRAVSEDKPIFLSIGYSTCHWCHVMERESFEDDEVAEVLNKYFISIKVDKEERPDIDSIYMSVCQALTGSGGWPMTILMTSDKKPFYAGTYFPKISKYGRPGLMDVLYSVEEAWRTRKEDLINSSKTIVDAVSKSEYISNKEKLSEDTLKKGYKEQRNNFDPTFGGFGNSPKFPIPHNLLFLLRYNYSFSDKESLEIVEKTLESMYKGGIFDHIGFGFSRYSVDRKWLVPHFEKMLYDNALLALGYTEAFHATKKEFYKEAADKIFTYILRDMTSPEGGFFSAEDADSEGIEGKFYLWDYKEVINILGDEDGSLFCKYYDITLDGNFEKKNIPNLISMDLHEIEDDKILKSKLENLRAKLFEEREKRIHPHKDDKILTSWNGLMIAALSYGGRVLKNNNYIDAARSAVKFIFKNLVREDSRLLARYRDGEAAHLGYLEDYAFLIWGLIELYESTFETEYLSKALELNSEMLILFSDEKGGFYLYGADSEELIIRPKEIYDGALPSGNSAAAYNLIRLARITGDSTLEEEAQKVFDTFAGTISNNPSNYSLALIACIFNFKDTKEIVIAGDKKDPDTQKYMEIINEKYLPLSTLILNNKNENTLEKFKSLNDKQMLGNKSTVYICQNFTCGIPINDENGLRDALNGST